MNKFFAILFFGVLQMATFELIGQTMKIGYCNVELILSNMPETAQAQSSIETFRKKWQEKLQVKQAYGQQLYEDFQRKKEANQFKPGEEENAKKEILKLEEELQQSANDADKEIQKKTLELLQPIQDKVKKAIDEISAAENYTFILNSYVNGSSIVLTGPKGDDLTEKILKKMGITLKDSTPATPKVPAGGK
jgi:outer membrane protein